MSVGEVAVGDGDRRSVVVDLATGRVIGGDAHEPTPDKAIYLSGHDIRQLGHYAHPIPLSKGHTQQHVAVRYPGWSWNRLYPPLVTGVPLRRSSTSFAPVLLPNPFVGVLLHPGGRIELDDGSLEHPAKTDSYRRDDGVRLAESLRATHTVSTDRVVIHAPHTSRHIPSAVRSELLLGDAAVRAELAAVTDAGVRRLVRTLSQQVGVRAYCATFSRLVFDPERFPEGDPAEQHGMGLVYTRRANGAVLRAPLDDDRLQWYRQQHTAYTRSMERVVSGVIDAFGSAVILDLHSYPARPLGYEDRARPRPEVCLGVDPVHTPDWLLAAARRAFRDFEVGIDTPFSGAYVPGRLFGVEPRARSVMVEVRRDVLAQVAGTGRVAAAVASLIADVRRER